MMEVLWYITVINDITQRMHNFEIIGLEKVCIRITVSTYNIYILGIYRSPKLFPASIDDFLCKFESGVKKK
jgi:hypothetical protein